MRDYFQRLAPQWDSLHPPEAQAEAIALGLGYLQGGWQGKTLVDIGCGTGVLLPQLLKGLGAGRLWAIDFAEQMIAVAQSKCVDARLRFVCADALSWQPEGRIDGVLCYNGFPHFPREKALETFASWLEPGGFFLCWHGASRPHINNIHRQADPTVSLHTVAKAHHICTLAQHFGFCTLASIDNTQHWLVLLQKENTAQTPPQHLSP
ncbi:MAG: class I SAM-dependent methyltransferase [Cystobacterineae bacterium]|nr:class I SAM-dependent methyltransferase [Cystobacterineae bacterium]